MQWRLQGLRGPIHRPIRKKERKKLRKPVQTFWNAENVPMTRGLMRAYLIPADIASYRFGCHVECFLKAFHHPQASSSCVQRATALAVTGNQGPKPIRFDSSDTFPAGIDCNALYCMVNSKHLLEDLKITPHDKRRVDVINNGLAIVGECGFTIMDDNGKPHTIRITNSLYLPGLNSCLLSPLHWAQEAGDNQTFMGSFAHCCTLHWGDGFVKTIPFNPTTNTPISTLLLHLAPIKHTLQHTRHVRRPSTIAILLSKSLDCQS